ncbi:MAG: hypothetical protein ACYS80_08040 [Planctomycetota bacterium]|jgi:hypothetical protein
MSPQSFLPGDGLTTILFAGPGDGLTTILFAGKMFVGDNNQGII